MKIPTCHPDRPHAAKGLCRDCYNARRSHLRRTRAQRRPKCRVCRERFTTFRRDSVYCSKTCRDTATAWEQTKQRGARPVDEEVIATRDKAFAASIARTARERGLKRVHPNAAGSRVVGEGYYSAWHRGGGLYLVRVRWPAVEESEVADSPRYQMLGNAVTVPVAEWIARRIMDSEATQ